MVRKLTFQEKSSLLENWKSEKKFLDACNLATGWHPIFHLPATGVRQRQRQEKIQKYSYRGNKVTLVKKHYILKCALLQTMNFHDLKGANRI